MKALDQAQREGETEVLQAVLGAPAMLSGMSENERAVRTRMYHESNSPEIAARLKAMHKANSLIEQRAGLFMTSVPKAMGADWHRINKLRAARMETEKAFIVRELNADAV